MLLKCAISWRFYKKKTLKIALEGLIKLAATYFPTWYSSIIGTNGLNFSVRYGKRWIPIVITTIIYRYITDCVCNTYSILMREKHFGYRLLDYQLHGNWRCAIKLSGY